MVMDSDKTEEVVNEDQVFACTQPEKLYKNMV